MTRHLIDTAKTGASARVARFAEIERARFGAEQSPKLRMLMRRHKGVSDPSRIKQFLRIERGRLA